MKTTISNVTFDVLVMKLQDRLTEKLKRDVTYRESSTILRETASMIQLEVMRELNRINWAGFGVFRPKTYKGGRTVKDRKGNLHIMKTITMVHFAPSRHSKIKSDL